MKQYYSNYGQYSNDWCIKNGIIIRSIDNKNYYSIGELIGNRKNVFYLNRISGKNKVRILKRGETMRNIIEITFNNNKWFNYYALQYLLARLPILNYLKMGSCQQYIRHGIIKEVLANVYNNNNLQSRHELLINKV